MKLITCSAVQAIMLSAHTRQLFFTPVAPTLSAPLPDKDKDGDETNDEQKPHQDEDEQKLSVSGVH